MRRFTKQRSDGSKRARGEPSGQSRLTGETALLPATPPVPSATTRWVPWVIILIVIVLAAIVRIRLLEIPLERDEGEYAYAGQLVLQGVPPYQAAFNMKFPGVYVGYALIMAVFGQTIGGIHLGFLLLNAGTTVLIFLLGRRLITTTAGVAAAAAYALLSVGQGVLGSQAHATHFVIAAALGGTLLLLRAIDSGSLQWLFWSGLLYGVSIVMKQNGAVFAIFGGLYLLWDHWRRHRGSRPAMLRRLGIFLLGSVVPLSFTVFVLWRAGVFDRFWFWTITYARQYASENSLDHGVTFFMGAFPNVVGPNLMLWILAAVGVEVLWWKRENRTSAVFVTAFLFFSFLAVCPGLYFRAHYFVLMLPAIALLAGATVSSTRKVTWWMYGVVLLISIAEQREFLFHATPIEASRRMYGFCPFPEAIQIGAYLRTHTAKDSRIAVLGSEPEIYFYANRRSATGYIYTYALMETQPFALAMQEEMIRELENARPEYVVFVNMDNSWMRLRDSYVKIDDWWNAYAQNYTLAGVADMISADRTEYHWDHLEPYLKEPSFISIFKRKGK
jgi:hypothetical protein